MPFIISNKVVHGQASGGEAQEVRLLSGAQGSTIVKSLEIVTGPESCVVEVIRKNSSSVAYATVKLDMKAYDYLVLWEGFFVIPYGDSIWIKAESSQCTVIANVVERTNS